MPSYKAPVDDALFLLNDVFHLDRYGNLPGFADAAPDIVEAVLREAGKFSEEVLTPLIASATARAAPVMTMAASQRPPASRTPSSNWSKAAGSAFRCRPNSAARACRQR